MKCQCPQCSILPAYTWTPEHRMECEARYLMAMPLDQRREELAHPSREKRVEELKRLMLKMWREK